MISRRKRKIVEINDTNLTNDELAEDMTSKKTKKSTKDAYKLKIRTFVEWCRKNRPDSLDSLGDVIIPMEIGVVTQFFGYLSIPVVNRSKISSSEQIPEKEEDPPSYSTLTTYRSALVDLYSQKNLKVSDEWNTRVKGILEGYEKSINELRSRGLMKNNEGKRFLNFSWH
jgi:hypothetical protein